MTLHDFYMNEALIEARKAYALGEVPIGAIIVRDGRIIARAYNTRESDKSPLAHAEISVIDKASKHLNGWRLTRCDIYVTLEPCLMCAGAIYQSRIVNLYYGATDQKAGAIESMFRVLEEPRLNHRVQLNGGVLKDECSEILSDFFKTLRQNKKDRKS